MSCNNTHGHGHFWKGFYARPTSSGPMAYVWPSLLSSPCLHGVNQAQWLMCDHHYFQAHAYMAWIKLALVLFYNDTMFIVLVNFHQISTWKIWFWPTQKVFHGKNDPNSPNFEFIFSNGQIFMINPNG
jgi:hypothetical protein